MQPKPEAHLNRKAVYRLSPLVCIRPVAGEFRLEGPFAEADLTITPALFTVFSELVGGARISTLLDHHSSEHYDLIIRLLRRCLRHGWIERVRSESTESTATAWDYYNAQAHIRARSGKGATVTPDSGEKLPFSREKLPVAVRRLDESRLRALPPPSQKGDGCQGVSLASSLENRRSQRTFLDEAPLPIKKLSTFLHYCCKVKKVVTLKDGQQITRRTYPSGGSLYPLEVYLVSNNCEQLERDLYYYHPVEHALARMDVSDTRLSDLLSDAAAAAGIEVFPPLLICISCRFQRMQAKYAHLAYSLVLKEVGCLYQSMWLVGNALDLAVCGLGTGNSGLFSRAIDTDYFEETTVGELILGPQGRAVA